MHKIIAVACIVALFLTSTDAVLAGLGDPLASDTTEESLKELKSSVVYRQALEVLKEKGYSMAQADAALEKLPPAQIQVLGAKAGELKSGGLLDFLLFVLFVALIVYLIILLIDASNRPGYYRRY